MVDHSLEILASEEKTTTVTVRCSCGWRYVLVTTQLASNGFLRPVNHSGSPQDENHTVLPCRGVMAGCVDIQRRSNYTQLTLVAVKRVLLCLRYMYAICRLNTDTVSYWMDV